MFPFISPFLDSSNFGGLKGDSPSYYLINLLHFIHSYLDQKVPHAVLLATSSRFELTGSCPQGILLSFIFFIVTFNQAFLRPRFPRELLKCTQCRKYSSETAHCVHFLEDVFTAKFLDDSSQVRAINLQTDLVENSLAGSSGGNLRDLEEDYQRHQQLCP